MSFFSPIGISDSYFIRFPFFLYSFCIYSPSNECWQKTSCMASLRPSLKPSRAFPDGSLCKRLCLMSSTALQPCFQTETSQVGAPALLIYGTPSTFVSGIHNNTHWVLNIFQGTVSKLYHLILTIPLPYWYHYYLYSANEGTGSFIFNFSILQVICEYIVFLNIKILQET